MPKKTVREKTPRSTVPARPLLRRLLLASAITIASAAVVISFSDRAQSQINGRITSAPSFAAKDAADFTSAKIPKAPVQVQLPPPPPIRYVPGMAEALVATGPVTDEENKDLDAALKAFHDAPANTGPDGDYDDYAKPLLAFIAAHPHSNWNAALNLNIGLGYYGAGYFSRVPSYFKASWELSRTATSAQATRIADRAMGEFAMMHAKLGHRDELKAFLDEVGNRPVSNAGSVKMDTARYALDVFNNSPGMGYLCGPAALRNVLVTTKADKKQIKVADDARSGPHGFSLTDLASLARKAGLKYSLIYRTAGQPIPVPSIINWKVHHYAALVGEGGERYFIKDPTFGAMAGDITSKAIDSEESGYFLAACRT